MKTFLTSAAFAAAMLIAIPAAAQTAPRAEPVAVRYADLDLSTEAGLAAFELRVRDAVHAACEASPADVHRANAAPHCRADLTARFNAQRDLVLAARGTGTLLAARQ
jgi:UrcA family protein